MKTIELANGQLNPTINFLRGMSLKAADSRHRTKLVKLLGAAVQEFAESELSLMQEYCKLDENGELQKSADGNYTLKEETMQEYYEEYKKLIDEKAVIEGGQFAKNIDEMPRILNEYTEELTGDTAEIYDKLLDELENETDE